MPTPILPPQGTLVKTFLLKILQSHLRPPSLRVPAASGENRRLSGCRVQLQSRTEWRVVLSERAGRREALSRAPTAGEYISVRFQLIWVLPSRLKFASCAHHGPGEQGRPHLVQRGRVSVTLEGRQEAGLTRPILPLLFLRPDKETDTAGELAGGRRPGQWAQT